MNIKIGINLVNLKPSFIHLLLETWTHCSIRSWIQIHFNHMHYFHKLLIFTCTFHILFHELLIQFDLFQISIFTNSVIFSELCLKSIRCFLLRKFICIRFIWTSEQNASDLGMSITNFATLLNLSTRIFCYHMFIYIHMFCHTRFNAKVCRLQWNWFELF